MKGQRGQAFILVLILLVVGALTIAPALNYIFTGLRSQRISEDIMADQYTANSALEDVLWQMLGDIQDPEVGKPETTYEFALGEGRGGIATVVEIPYVPPAEWTEYTARGHLAGVMVETEPPYLDASADDASFHYIIRVRLGKVNALETFGFTLPQNVEYADNSTYGLALLQVDLEDYLADPPEFNSVNVTSHEVQLIDETWQVMELGPDPTETLSEGKWALEWDVDIDEAYTGMYFIICNVTGNPPGGVSYVEPWFDGDFTIVEMEACGALGYGFYIIRMEVEGVTYEVIVAFDSTPPGSWKIISYRIVE